MKIGNIFSAIDISASGLSLQRKKMDAIASNLANIDSIGSDGKPYEREEVKAVPGQAIPFVNELENQLGSSEASDSDIMDVAPDDFISPDLTIRKVDGKVVQEPAETKSVYDPTNPAADANGYVTEPKVNVVTEMVDMIATTRSYEANVTAINASKNIIKDSLEI